MNPDMNILELIEERKLRWFGRVTSKGEGRIPKIFVMES